MMIIVYKNLRTDSGGIIPGITKLFVQDVDTEGNIIGCKSGTLLTPEGSGTMFIVDAWLIEQLDKVQFIDGTLSVKDGEALIPPVKSEKELLREELLKQLAELDSQPDEEVNVDG